MRIAFFRHSGDGTWCVATLGKHHEVTWTIEKDKYADALRGIVPPPKKDITSVDDYDLVVFDDATHGELADSMRETTPTIGSSALAERLENDRLYGLQVMEGCGIEVPPYEAFNDVKEAKRWLSQIDRRCVFKPCGYVEDKATTYVAKS